MKKILIALVLAVVMSGNVYAEPFDWSKEDQSRYQGVYPDTDPLKKEQKELLLRIHQCDEIKQELLDKCILKNLNTSDTFANREIKNACIRKSENIPFSEMIFYKNFYKHGFNLCKFNQEDLNNLKTKISSLKFESSDFYQRKLKKRQKSSRRKPKYDVSKSGYENQDYSTDK